MPVRPYRPEDRPLVGRLPAESSTSQADFVLNPMWEDEAEFQSEFDRHGIDPGEHLLVDEREGELIGLSGLLRWPVEPSYGALLCPVVARAERGRGAGGDLLRSALEHASDLGVKLVTAGIGTRNRSGYSLLTAHGFRPLRQHFLMKAEGPPEEAETVEAEIQVATPEDRAEVAALYERCGFEFRSEARWEEILGGPRHFHGVARKGGQLTGFVELETHWPGRSWVSFVGVDPELREQGLGSALVGWALAQRAGEGAHSALLVLSPSNRGAVRAYEKVGFRIHRTFDVLEREV